MGTAYRNMFSGMLKMMGTLTRVLPPTGALCFDRAVRMATWARCRVMDLGWVRSTFGLVLRDCMRSVLICV